MKEEAKNIQCKHGYRGDCCCNCRHQVKIHCHPLNGEQKGRGFLEDRSKVGKGGVNEQFAWGCAIFDNNPYLSDSNDRIIIYSDREHGMCGMHCRISE